LLSSSPIISKTNGKNVRKVVLMAVGLALLVLPALANDGVLPEPNGNPTRAHDRLTQTPMTCLMPPLPSLLMDNGETPMDFVKTGAVRLNDFMQNADVYLHCVGTKAWIAANAAYQKFAAAAQVQMQRMQNKPAPAN
jgi:hypothetical protein